MSVVRPGFLQWEEWAATLLIDYPVASQPPKAEFWKEWADSLVINHVLGPSNIPTTQGFTDWKDWAEQVAGAV